MKPHVFGNINTYWPDMTISPDGLTERCASTDGALRCVGNENHYGPHWANLAGDKAWRWGMRGYGCYDNLCVREPGHTRPHNDGKGCSWSEAEAYDETEDEATG